MIGAEVLAEVVADGGIRMRHRDVPECLIATVLVCPHQQLKVHHVVDDHRVLPPGIRIPGHDAADARIEPADQRAGSLQQHIAIGRFLRQAETVSVTAVQHEPEIVGASVVFLFFDPGGEVPCVFPELLIPRPFIQKPKSSGEKSTCPPAGIAWDQLAVCIGRTGQLPRVGPHRHHHVARLLRRHAEIFFDPSAGARLRVARTGKYSQEQGSGAQLSHHIRTLAPRGPLYSPPGHSETIMKRITLWQGLME